jgi:hypothetical protein
MYFNARASTATATGSIDWLSDYEGTSSGDSDED